MFPPMPFTKTCIFLESPELREGKLIFILVPKTYLQYALRAWFNLMNHFCCSKKGVGRPHMLGVGIMKERASRTTVNLLEGLSCIMEIYLGRCRRRGCGL